MRPIFLFLLVILTACSVWGTHLIVGDLGQGAELAHTENIQYNAYPFMKRVKYYFYTQQDNRKIRAIQALDNLHSHASMNITAGGIGHTFVNLRMKSERGQGLDYALGIYVEPVNYLGNMYPNNNNYYNNQTVNRSRNGK